jgi:short-subunit dehydrogenase
VAASAGRPVDACWPTPGAGWATASSTKNFTQAKLVLDTNVTGTIYLIHQVASRMRARGRGRILITGSIAGFMPGSYQAVYNGTKAFLDSFSMALRNELKDSGVTVSCLMPGPTDTEFFERADMLDTKVGQGKKADPAEVARIGFEAMLDGEGDVVRAGRTSCRWPWRRSRRPRCWPSSIARWPSRARLLFITRVAGLSAALHSEAPCRPLRRLRTPPILPN